MFPCMGVSTALVNDFVSGFINRNAESPKIMGEMVTPPISFPIRGILVDLKIVESREFPEYQYLAHIK